MIQLNVAALSYLSKIREITTMKIDKMGYLVLYGVHRYTTITFTTLVG